jgi:hypothetical protein
MKRYILFQLLFFYSFFCLFTEDFRSGEFVNKIPNGNKEGEVYFSLYGSPREGPNAIVISELNLLYIDDHLNRRIAVFDLNCKFIRNMS